MPKNDLSLAKPLMNAAGFLGFAPEPKGVVDLSAFGAFVTNPVSRRPRTPAHGQRFASCAGGFLLHTGLPNPGLSAVLRKAGRKWAHSPVPVIVHLLALETGEMAEMVYRLEGVEGVMGIEIGLPPEADENAAFDFTQAAAGELPVIVRLPPENCERLALAAVEAGASAISLGAPRGLLPGEGGRMFAGRLYGPAVFPLALRAVQQLAGLGLPVIGAGGVYSERDAAAMLEAGALAVQLDAWLWRE
jgi:dihydroorotate dehydrogenase (NAD+) catalytic subunit